MTEPIEFRLRAWRRPVRYGLLLWLAFVLGIPAAGGLALLHVAPPLAILGGTMFSLGVIAWILHKDHRAIPAGSLRLEPGKLTFTAWWNGPIEMRASEVRDLYDNPIVGSLMIRRKSGPPSIFLDPARLDVPLAVVKAALVTWMSEAGDDLGAAFVARSVKVARREDRRVRVMRWCAVGAAACAVLRVIVLLVAGK